MPIDFTNKRNELFHRVQEVNDLNGAASVLIWDQSTYMPTGGSKARGRQLATLRRLAHEKFTDPSLGRLLNDLSSHTSELADDSDDAALIAVTLRKYEDAICIPPDFAAQFAEHSTAAYTAWVKARANNDFTHVQPFLDKTLDYSRRFSSYFTGHQHLADPLINQSDYGMTVATIRPIFGELRERTILLLNRIQEQKQVDSSCLYQHFPEGSQWEFGIEIAKKFGYDMNRGRQDKTPHPFAIKFSIDDVRITSRFSEDRLDDGLFSTLHETGHALYEQGISPSFEGTHLNHGTSAGVHESQSRLWENLVGRSRLFWQHYYPHLQEKFPSQLGTVSLDSFYKAINRVEPSLIRTDADEVTYNLHVIIRFDLELDLLEGKLAVADLPEAWHARYQTDLGVSSPTDADGVLQDVHWFGGLIGGSFQGYTLGNILASQFFAKATEDEPTIGQEMGQGQMGTLHRWLRENIYHHGSKYTAPELIKRVTGGGLLLEPYFSYLNTKYGEIYGFDSTS
ncbi:MAG: carboxypeptidase M32 [Chloroflexota bacterium]